MLWQSMARNALGLTLFAIVTVGVIAVTEVGTRDAIEEQRAAAQRRALLEILPADTFDNAILEDVVQVSDPALGLERPASAFIARRQGRVVAAVLPVQVPDGYSGAIRLIVGIRPDGTLAGVRVLEHRETPGLGDKIEIRKSDWMRNFEGRSIGDPPAEMWTVRKDGGAFDAFTGATITPRAVIRGVYRALDWFERSGRARLLPSEQQAQPDASAQEAAALAVDGDEGGTPREVAAS